MHYNTATVVAYYITGGNSGQRDDSQSRQKVTGWLEISSHYLEGHTF